MSSAHPNPNPTPTPTEPPPPVLRMVMKPDRGRSLVAAGPIKPGQIVLSDSPLLLYPSSLSCLSFFCSRCFRVLPSQPFLCPSCHVSLFCSARCLSLSHPPLLCLALPSLLSGLSIWPDDLLFLLSAYSLPSRSLLQLLSLHSISQFPDESIEILHSELCSLIPPNLIPMHFSPETTSSLISKEKMNSFSLMNPMDAKFEGCGVAGARACGIYLMASLVNHDCLPNVCRFDYIDDPNRENNTDITFRALHEIKDGSEICISYVGVSIGYRERQRRLLEYYGFKCKCNRCKMESQWEENQGEEEETGEENGEEEDTREEEETGEENEEEEDSREEEDTGEETGEEEEAAEEEDTGEETGEEEEAAEEEETGEENGEEEETGEENGEEEETGEEEVEVGKGEGEMEMSEEGGNGEEVDDDFLLKYMCDCGGYLAPLPPSHDGVVSNFSECNGCGIVRKDESGGTGGVRF